ncbi:hypothetical protein ACOQFV_02270 [Nocardiopsis changdeensis]|uniref:Uncharacterized protein n=1 Tax=Nocardiopsis changdeensis TaxID=2831969 RepID=A0ABX8BJP7_9ACTN|nr:MULTISPECIES: hypothetical protein [Nocardiopsis]QUX22474.1 hypothetical protein KGD84_29855 [Nocardiopsis changdeensis]QYX38416.1 hypothetical protein K1J57_07235 [Nocardiopsis sp. MT53]
MDPILIGGLAGAVGSVVTAFTTQLFAHRTKAQELRHAEQVRERQQSSEDSRAEMARRRTGYIALNSAAREYLTALTDLLRALELDEPRDEERGSIERVRAAYRLSYAEAQLSVNDDILGAASKVNRSLSSLFGLVKRLDHGNPRDGETAKLAETRRQDTWVRLQELRLLMRVDLGVGVPMAGTDEEGSYA